jgi:hypothetical protein
MATEPNIHERLGAMSVRLDHLEHGRHRMVDAIPLAIFVAGVIGQAAPIFVMWANLSGQFERVDDRLDRIAAVLARIEAKP